VRAPADYLEVGVALADARVVETDADLRGPPEEGERLVDRVDGFGPGRAVGGADLERARHPARQGEGLGEADRGRAVWTGHAEDALVVRGRHGSAVRPPHG